MPPRQQHDVIETFFHVTPLIASQACHITITRLMPRRMLAARLRAPMPCPSTFAPPHLFHEINASGDELADAAH